MPGSQTLASRCISIEEFAELSDGSATDHRLREE